MSYKKKQLKKIETKTLSFLKSNSKKTFNYKQIASNFGINDTKGRNDIIKVLNILTIKNKLVENKKGYSSKAKLLFGFGIVAFFVVIFKADDWIYSARKVASYDWGYECGYKSSYLYWEDWIESDRKTNFICGENKKYEYWGSAKWREGYRDGEVDGKKAYLRGNKKFCGSLPCDKEGAMQPTIDALTR